MPNSATYILILHLPFDSELDLDVLGPCDFPGGFYAYVGTVDDQTLLVSQLKKHLSQNVSPRQDIDFLQQIMQLEEIWLTAKHTPSQNDWVDLLLSVPGSMSLVEGFGGADVDSEWDSYLLYFDVRPTIEDFVVGFRQLFPDDMVVRAFERLDQGVQTE